MARYAPRRRGAGRLAARLTAASAGALGALAVANWLANLGVGDPEPPLSGATGYYPWTHGVVRYTVKGRGEPLALIHGIYPGASSFEYRNVFDRLAKNYRVFALDLLGFGQSGRPAIDYSPTLYVDLIEDFLRQVVGATDQPAHVVASGLSGAFVIEAAARRPRQFGALILIEPAGQIGAAPAPGRLSLALRRALLRSPLLGEGLYNLAVSRPGLRLLLGNTSYSAMSRVSDDVLDQYYVMAHQPGARFAPADARVGLLDISVSAPFASLTAPTLLVWGRRDHSSPVSRARSFQELRPGVELRVLPTGGMPQEEAPAAFLREATAWLRAYAPV